MLGSSIFNILFILGASSAIIAMPIDPKLNLDIFLMTVVTIVGALFTYTKSEVDKKEGLVLVLLYIAYMAFTIVREMGMI